MRQLFIITSILIAFWGCSSGNQETHEPASNVVESEKASTGGTESSPEQKASTDSETTTGFDALRMGMSEDETIELLGEPTKKETVGNDPKIYAEDWWYGENQKVRMINHMVNHVVKDVARQKDLLKQLMIAKKNNDEEAAKRIMDELTEGHN